MTEHTHAVPPVRARARARGVTILESLAAAAVLIIGILGAVQALGFASKQNADADKRTRATSLAARVRSAVEGYGWSRLTAAGGPLTACTSDAAVLELVQHLPAASGAGTAVCVIDLDAWDAAAQPSERVVPGHRAEDERLYRRVLVLFAPDASGGASVPASARAFREVAVVVSWRTGVGNRAQVTSMLGLYDPRANTGNETHVEI